VIGVDQ